MEHKFRIIQEEYEWLLEKWQALDMVHKKTEWGMSQYEYVYGWKPLRKYDSLEAAEKAAEYKVYGPQVVKEFTIVKEKTNDD